MIGKNAQGLKGFPTPNTATGIAGYLLFYFDDKEWAQYILGAARALGDPFNWYEAGDMSTDDAAETFRVIVQDAPYNLRTCPNPAGGRIFRVNALGRVQELSDAGTWEDPSGDATIPPVPEREGGTPEDQICLAAKNATNVLLQLYENITDSFNEGLDEAEAATALVLTIIGLIGSEFAPITFALVTFFSVVFSVLYGVLEFVGADLWDDTFTQALICILHDCATNDAGVVTFDWDCFQNALAAQTNVFDLTFEQLRLFGQLEYLLQVIGGADALNAAGATTAITDDDCSACTGWCYFFDFATGELGWEVSSGEAGSYGAGYWQGAEYNANSNTEIVIETTFTATPITYVAFEYRKDGGSGANNVVFARLFLSGSLVWSGTPISTNGDHLPYHSDVPNIIADRVQVIVNAGTSGAATSIYNAQLEGENDNPFGEDNC